MNNNDRDLDDLIAECKHRTSIATLMDATAKTHLENVCLQVFNEVATHNARLRETTTALISGPQQLTSAAIDHDTLSEQWPRIFQDKRVA